MGPPQKPYQPYADLHVDTKGAGDQRPTAMQVIQDEGLVGKLGGKVFLITGCSSGIGVETARALHATDADIYMTVRAEKKTEGEAVIKAILAKSNGKGKLELIFMDLASFDSIRAGAADFLSKSKSLNVLIENAGIMMCPKGKTADGFETQIGTNHFGHFVLFQLLKDALLASSTPDFQSRVVVVSSAGHRFSGIRFDDMNWDKGDYDPAQAYGQSKTANIYMANSIERHYGSKGLHATSVHPGGILGTGLGRHMDESTVKTMYSAVQKMLPFFKSAEQGAATQVWAAVDKHFNDQGGVYLADVGESEPSPPDPRPASGGYLPHAYDEEAEERLWKISCDVVGIKDY